MKLGLSPPKGWCEHGPPRLSAGLGCPSYQHPSLPRHPQGCPKGLRSLAVGPLASTVYRALARSWWEDQAMGGGWLHDSACREPPCRGHFAPSPWPHFPRPPWFRPGLRAASTPAHNGFFLWPQERGMTQGKSTSGQGSFPRADSSPWGWSSAPARPSRDLSLSQVPLLCPSRSADTEQTQETEGWRVLSQSVLLISRGKGGREWLWCHRVARCSQASATVHLRLIHIGLHGTEILQGRL